jgi:hypothetical protein
MAFSQFFHSLRSGSCSYARAGSSRLFSCAAVTGRSTANDFFECDGDSCCVCDERGQGFD